MWMTLYDMYDNSTTCKLKMLLHTFPVEKTSWICTKKII